MWQAPNPGHHPQVISIGKRVQTVHTPVMAAMFMAAMVSHIIAPLYDHQYTCTHTYII